MKKSKNQSGAISLFVLLSMLFFLVFMLGAFSLLTRRNASQIEALKETQAIYKSVQNVSDVYDSILANLSSNSNLAVPITNIQQLKKVIEIAESTEDKKANYEINGNVYTYSKKANYILQKDIILDLKQEIDGKTNIDIYDYILYSDKVNIDTNGHDIYYKQTDNSLWKCVCYQDIGTEDSSNVFSTIVGSSDYFGKSSFSSKLYSILEEGIYGHNNYWFKEDKVDDSEEPDDNGTYDLYYEFMLMYDMDGETFNVDKYMRWRQKNDPSKEIIPNCPDAASANATFADGYTIDFPGGTIENVVTINATEGETEEQKGERTLYWGGLTRSQLSDTGKICAYLDGSVGHHYWFYPVAITDKDTNVISVTKDKTASKSLLFVRVK